MYAMNGTEINRPLDYGRGANARAKKRGYIVRVGSSLMFGLVRKIRIICLNTMEAWEPPQDDAMTLPSKPLLMRMRRRSSHNAAVDAFF
jgi:hypothetical protein